jgi:hypothetical protein
MCRKNLTPKLIDAFTQDDKVMYQTQCYSSDDFNNRTIEPKFTFDKQQHDPEPTPADLYIDQLFVPDMSVPDMTIGDATYERTFY